MAITVQKFMSNVNFAIIISQIHWFHCITVAFDILNGAVVRGAKVSYTLKLFITANKYTFCTTISDLNKSQKLHQIYQT